MHGNVWEWCADKWSNYSQWPQNDPSGPTRGPGNVFRGGDRSRSAGSCRSATRLIRSPGMKLGFRLASVLADE